MSQNYDARDIKVLEGLDAVRVRPGMYIGTTGSRGMHHLLWEIVDNAVDEVANSYADEISVIVYGDGSVSVEDNGRGMPVDLHPQLKVSGVEVIFTQLHAGGKFDSSNYGYSGGLHGVGASVVNALSEWLNVEVYRDFKVYKCEFESKYDPEKRKVIAGRAKYPLREAGKTYKKGSLVSFKPDKTVFDGISFNNEIITKHLKEVAFLNKGVKITFTDERINDQGRVQEFKYEGGLIDFVKYLNEDKNAVHGEPIFIEGSRDDLHCALAIQYTDSYTESIFSYVNNINTPEGGTHETGFKSALTKALNDYARKTEILKEKDTNFVGEDFREGMTAILSLKMKNVQFEGQTKTKLGSVEARTAVEAIVYEKLTAFFEDYRNETVKNVIFEKAVQAAKVREAARKAKDLARKKNSLEGAPLVGKLASCTGRIPAENELFIVEGESAGGSAKQGRDRRFQAILPLKGKPLNSEKKRLDQVLANDEFRTIIAALGTGIDTDFDITALKYYKIIILSDADQDGAHIRAILLTFFYRYMKELITDGYVYIGKPPLYKIEKKATKEVVYAYSDEQLRETADQMGRGYTVQRYKGLGEMDPEQLWNTTMNPEFRTLVQVSIEDVAEAEKLITVLMGDKVDARKKYISDHANFNKNDSFLKMGV